MKKTNPYHPQDRNLALTALRLQQESYSVKQIIEELNISSTTYYRYINWANNTIERMSYTDVKGLKIINIK